MPNRYDVLDNSKIELAAALAADQLVLHSFAEVILTPGDATAYRFIVLRAGRSVPTSDGMTYCKDYDVILATEEGAHYPWSGQHVHPAYAAVKWSRDHLEWTGEVVARFLNALADHIGEVQK